MTHHRHFKHLHIPDHWEQYWSKYPNGYTLLEALINWTSQVNKMVDSANHTSDHVLVLERQFKALDKELRAAWDGYKDKSAEDDSKFKDEVHTIINNFIGTIDPRLQDIVTNSMTDWLNDGTLADIINKDVFNMKADQIDLDETNIQLLQTEQHQKDTEFAYPGLKAGFAWVDDDGRIEVLTKLKPIFDARGLKFTSAVVQDFVGRNANYMNLDQVKQLYKEGFEIASHTKTHRSLVSVANDYPSELEAEIQGSKDYFASHGIKVDHIMYPYGHYNDLVIKGVREVYKSGATMDYDWQTDDIKYNYRPIKTFNIGRQGVGIYGENPMNWTHIKQVIDNAIENKTMCVLMTHIAETDDAGLELIERAVDYIISLGYKDQIMTYGELYEQHRNRLEYDEKNMRYVQSKDYFIVDAEGKLHSSYGRAFFEESPIADYNENPAPKDYKENAFTMQRVLYSGAVKHGFPNQSAGYVFVINSKNTNSSFRFFMTLSGSLYKQNAQANASEWGEWQQLFNVLTYVTSTSTSGLNDKLPTAYAIGHTMEQVNYNDSEGLPVRSAGVMETIKAGGGTNVYTIRKFYPTSSPTDISFYMQRGTAEGWTRWVKFSETQQTV